MLQQPELRERIVNVLGGIPVGSTPAEFSQYIAAEVALNAPPKFEMSWP